MSDYERKGGLVRKLVALAVGAMAARLAMMAVEQLWRRGFRQELPGMTEEESLGRRVAWIGLTAAAVGMAREAARQVTAPKVKSA